MLENLLFILEEEKKNLYMEKITESISNGATKNNSLFHNVFQSKLFYVIYSRVKSWFGEEYKPVSDITVIRGKNAFATLILSSEPIQNHNSTETDFGIHYAFLEDFSSLLSYDTTKPGQRDTQQNSRMEPCTGKLLPRSSSNPYS